MLLLYLVFVIGINFKNDILCTAASLLIQYFALASAFWMGAEAILMIRKLVIVFGTITRVFHIVLSLCCWSKLGHVAISQASKRIDFSLKNELTYKMLFSKYVLVLFEPKSTIWLDGGVNY